METAWIVDGTRILQAIGRTLIHSLWQAAVVYGLLSALLKAVPALPSRARYASALAALGAIVLWSLHTLYRHWPATQLPTVPYPGAGFDSVAAAPGVLFWLDEAIPWLMMAYGLGLGLMLGRMLTGFSEVRRLRRSGVAISGELAARLTALISEMGLKRSVQLRQSGAVAVPMVIGLLRPVILLPHSCLESLSPAALEAILLHELAHIRRADYFVNILQTVVEAVLFFNPFVRRISSLLRREREHCCDDLVISHSGQPFEYAAALASLAAGGRQPAFALGASGGRYPLLNRIKRITTMDKKPSRPGNLIIASGIAALLIAISIACFTPAFGQKKPKTAPAATTPPPATPPQAPVPPQATVAPPAPPAAPALPNSFRALVASEEIFKQLPAIIDSAFAISGDAMKQVDWDEVRRELRKASKEIEAIDWQAIRRQTQDAMAQASKEIDAIDIDRDVESALAEAEHAIDRQLTGMARQEKEPQSKEYREAVAESRKDLLESREVIAEQRRQFADERGAATRAHRDAKAQMREAQAQMERARQEMEAARRQMEQARKEMARAQGAK